jgi:hypothetical protein
VVPCFGAAATPPPGVTAATQHGGKTSDRLAATTRAPFLRGSPCTCAAFPACPTRDRHRETSRIGGTPAPLRRSGHPDAAESRWTRWAPNQMARSPRCGGSREADPILSPLELRPEIGA